MNPPNPLVSSFGSAQTQAFEVANAAQARYKALGMALVALLTGLALTSIGVMWQRSQLEALAQAQFRQEADRIEAEIQRRLTLPQYGLKGLRGTYAASPQISRSGFRAYVESRDLAREFPGIRGIGFIERIRRDQLDSFVRQVRADDAPTFNVKTSGGANDLFVIKFIEPMVDNVAAWGYDVGQEPIRRAGAERAMNTGLPALTAKISLVQDSRKTAGFLLYVPVYRTGTDLSTPAQRQAALLGLAYTPIVAAELFRDLTGGSDANANMEIYQGTEPTEAQLLYRDAVPPDASAPHRASRHMATREMTLAGSVITAQVFSTMRFERLQDHSPLTIAGILGVGISVAIAFALWLVAAGRVRAQQLAQSMMGDLDRMARVVQHTNSAVAVSDAQLRITWVNAGFTRLTGYSLEQALGKTPGELLSSGKADPQSLQTLAMSAAAGIACRVEVLNRARDGREYWVDTEVQPLRDASQQLVGFMEIGTDITQQKLTQQRLESAMRQASAILSAVEMHAIVSVSDRTGVITDVNEAFCELSGYTRDELLGQEHTLLNSGHHTKAFWQGMWEQIASGEPWRGDICNRAKNGSLYWVDSMIAPFMGDDGQVEKYVSIRTNITTRVMDQQKLVELSDRMALAIEGGNDALWDWMDISRDEQWWSPSYHTMLGFGPDELIPSVSNYRSLLHPDSVAVSRERVEVALAGGAAYDLELRLRTKHAGYRWFRVRAKAFFDSQGKAIRMAGSTQDIHERKLAQDAQAESEAFLDRAGRIAGVGGWRVDLQANTLHWSRETRRIHEVADDFVPTLEQAIHFYTPEVQSIISTAVQQGIETGKGWDLELPLTTASGRSIWVRTVGEVEFENGVPVLLLGAIQDVTERRKLNLAIRTSNQLMTDVLQNLPCGLSVFDGNLVLVAQNPQLRSLLGLPDSLFEGPVTTFEQVIRYNARAGEYGPGDEDAIVASIVERARHPVAHIFERERPNGVPLEIRGVPLPGGGFITTYVDISESKKAQHLLTLALEAAQQASVSKSQFLANMSHEIRTPMNAILGMLRLLQNTELSVRQQDYVGKTEGAARSLLGLLNDILDFSKVEAGKMTLDPRPFRLDGLLRDLSVILSASVGQKDVEVLFDIDPDLPQTLVGDDMRLQQVLINLGGNAIKFTERGEVVLRLRMLDQTPDTVTVAFAVQDSGVGIAPENQALIFNGFSQAEASTTRRFGGTGLGLAISSRLTSLMGGELKLHSALGAGSTFYFQLPLARVAPDATAAPAALPLALRTLVVEDNPIARELMVNMALSLGWQVDAASNGPEAVAQVQSAAVAQRPYQAIFVDWHMPDMDGWQTSRRIREMPVQGEPPLIVMVTAHDRELLTQRTAQEQALLNGFLVKPVTASMLLELVQDARSANALAASGHDPMARRPVEKLQRLKGLHILVVEDNQINQVVAQGLLSAEGAVVSLAEDGQRGLDAVASARPGFDIVLMDLQMPVMDGHTATRILRTDMGLSALPVIAMTANAMASDRAACLAAGMNDHVGKPFELDHLVATILRYTGARPDAMPVPEPAPVLQASVAQPADWAPGDVDLEAAVLRMGGDTRMFHGILQTFAADLPDVPGRLAAQWAQGNSQDAVRTLHTLKGLAATVGARQLAQVAARLEAQCRGASLTGDVFDLVAQLQRAVDATLHSLAPVLQQFVPAAKQVSEVADHSSIDRNAVRSDVVALTVLLRASDMRALDAFARLRDRYGAPLGAALDPLDRAMVELEFEEAAQCCAALLDGVLAQG